ncbi:MAG TPA: hypothetical protein VFH03_00305 [Actinoplanes sp.]|nr:hypothetical protein [Actinoplanes sp.]
MTTQAPDRIWSNIDIAKTLAGALAAVCAAVAGSFLGVAGTLVGAAIASIIGSVGTEIYARSLKRGAEKLQTYAPTFVKAPAAVGTPPVEAASEEDSPSHTLPAEPRPQLPWRRIAMITGVVFVLAMGAITAVELFAGRSVASMFGHDSAGATTVSSVTDRGGDRPDNQPATTPSDAPSAESTAPEQAPTPAETPVTTDPSTQPTTGAPTSPAPQQEPAGGTDPDQPEQDPQPDGE